MTERIQVTLQKAFVLHYRSYRETSLIVDVFSREFGKLSVIAKGARRAKSKFMGILQPFRLLKLSWVGKSELCTLTDAEIVLPVIELSGDSLYCGFYLNELLCHFLYRHDPHAELFLEYQHTLSLLESKDVVEQSLRFFELSLLKQLGYGLQIKYDAESGKPIDANKSYRYGIETGPVEAKPGTGTIHGSTLIGLQCKQFNDPVALSEAKRLLREVIDFHLGGKQLMSRLLFFSARKPNSSTTVCGPINSDS